MWGKKDSSKVKGKLRRAITFWSMNQGPPNSGHESLSALARQEPWSVGEPVHHCGLVPTDNEAAQSSLSYSDLAAAAAGTGAKSEHSRVLGSSQSEWLWKSCFYSCWVAWPHLFIPGFNQSLWILRGLHLWSINCLSVSSIRAPLQITEEVLDGRWPKFPASSLILPSSKETW